MSSRRGITVAADFMADRGDGHGDDSTVVVVHTADQDRVAEALLRSARRLQGLDQHGVEHPTLDDLEAALDEDPDLDTPSDVSDVYLCELGPTIVLDWAGGHGPAFREAAARIVTEELRASGITEADIRPLPRALEHVYGEQPYLRAKPPGHQDVGPQPAQEYLALAGPFHLTPSPTAREQSSVDVTPGLFGPDRGPGRVTLLLVSDGDALGAATILRAAARRVACLDDLGREHVDRRSVDTARSAGRHFAETSDDVHLSPLGPFIEVSWRSASPAFADAATRLIRDHLHYSQVSSAYVRDLPVDLVQPDWLVPISWSDDPKTLRARSRQREWAPLPDRPNRWGLLIRGRPRSGSAGSWLYRLRDRVRASSADDADAFGEVYECALGQYVVVTEDRGTADLHEQIRSAIAASLGYVRESQISALPQELMAAYPRSPYLKVLDLNPPMREWLEPWAGVGPAPRRDIPADLFTATRGATRTTLVARSTTDLPALADAIRRAAQQVDTTAQRIAGLRRLAEQSDPASLARALREPSAHCRTPELEVWVDGDHTYLELDQTGFVDHHLTRVVSHEVQRSGARDVVLRAVAGPYRPSRSARRYEPPAAADGG